MVSPNRSRIMCDSAIRLPEWEMIWVGSHPTEIIPRRWSPGEGGLSLRAQMVDPCAKVVKNVIGFGGFWGASDIFLCHPRAKMRAKWPREP